MNQFFSKISFGAVFRWIILALGIFGVILPALVDMFPYDSWTSVLYLKELDIGFAELNNFDTTIRFSDSGTKTTGSVLSRHEKGYNAIYNLLRTINPELPSLQDIALSDPDEGAIFVYDGSRWRNKGGSIPMFRPVQLSLREDGVIPICELKDLPYLIRDYKVRFWSRLGSILALLGLIIPIITPLPNSTTTSRNPQKLVNHPKVTVTPKEQTGKVNVSNENKHKVVLGLFWASIVYIILSASLFVKFRKAAKNRG